MKLQRWNVARGGLDTEDVFDDKGEWVRWADVDALLASIREAVAAERGHSNNVVAALLMCARSPVPDETLTSGDGWKGARAALDALLSGEGA